MEVDKVVFLIDVDNTVLDNDTAQSDYVRHMRERFGGKAGERYWSIFLQLKDELGYADYLGALQRYRLEDLHDPQLLFMSSYLLDYSFRDRLYRHALDLIKHLGTLGTTVIFSDGDVVFQPRKVERSGLRDAVDGRVLIYVHKETELDDVERLYPADHYVLIDDKLRILESVKQIWHQRVTTVQPLQGHYANDLNAQSAYQPADVTVTNIGDLLKYDSVALIEAGRSRERPPLVTKKTLKATVQKSRRVLVVDVGGTHVKLLATGHQQERKIPSGPQMTANSMVEEVRRCTTDWEYDVVSIGYPGPVIHGKPLAEPHNLGTGWVGFDFSKAFGCPVKVINDAAMQALGSYEGGRMLFLGLGAGLGSALIIDGVLAPMELAHLPYKDGKTYEDYVGVRGLERLGKKKWRREVSDVATTMKDALEADYVVLGGGNANKIESLPPDTRRGNNRNAFIGGFRLWEAKTMIGEPKGAMTS